MWMMAKYTTCDIFYFILGSPVMYLLDVVYNLYKLMLSEAPPQSRLQASATPLQLYTGDLLSSGGFGFGFFRDIDVFDSFVKGLVVSFLL
jgi:hypothetical protein